MRFPIDADLAVFAYTLGKIVFSLPRLRRSSRPVPIRYDVEQVEPSALTERQAEYLKPYDEKLATMNYLPVCTYRVSNYGQCLLRNYVNPMETSRCVVMIYELNRIVAGRPSPTNSCTMSFHTRFTDGTVLTTRNSKLKSILDRAPYWVIQERPYITEPAEMKRAHDAKAAKMGCPVPPPSDAATVIKDLHSEHERFCAYQLSTGSYKLRPDGRSYAIGDRPHWRGIVNHLNPFAHRFYALRFLPAVLLGIALPIVGVLKLAPQAAAAAQRIGFPPATAAEVMMTACYMVAGAVIGYVLERQTFVWVFLLTYIPVRIVAAGSLGPVPYSAFAGLVAYSVAQAKKRRRAVLVPAR